MNLFRNIDHPYIIAEIGANHNGDLDLAYTMIDKAKECGADAVKFQHFDRYNFCTQKSLDDLDQGIVKLENVPSFDIPELSLHSIKDQMDAFSFTKDQMIDVLKYTKNKKLDFGCTTEDIAGAEFLLSIGVDFIKVASSDCTNIALINFLSTIDCPVLLSTGMATFEEIETAYKLLNNGTNNHFALLHCVSVYPPDSSIINLKFIETLKSQFSCPIGYSDHTLGISITLASIAVGAVIIEKHFTLDKSLPGWDHSVSANPQELTNICNESKEVYKSLGSHNKNLSSVELSKIPILRKSVTANRFIKSGEKLTFKDICFKRPGDGIPSNKIYNIIGSTFLEDVCEDETIYWHHIKK
jgi:N-acetylneuraminate synthase